MPVVPDAPADTLTAFAHISFRMRPSRFESASALIARSASSRRSNATNPEFLPTKTKTDTTFHRKNTRH